MVPTLMHWTASTETSWVPTMFQMLFWTEDMQWTKEIKSLSSCDLHPSSGGSLHHPLLHHVVWVAFKLRGLHEVAQGECGEKQSLSVMHRNQENHMAKRRAAGRKGQSEHKMACEFCSWNWWSWWQQVHASSGDGNQIVRVEWAAHQEEECRVTLRKWVRRSGGSSEGPQSSGQKRQISLVCHLYLTWEKIYFIYIQKNVFYLYILFIYVHIDLYTFSHVK